VWLSAVGLCAVAGPGTAHHAFVSVFDPDQPLNVLGTVTKVEWMNPHVWFYLDVEDDDGEVENWGFEMGSPNALVRRGWSHDSLKVGQIVNVVSVRARDGTLRGAVRSVTLESGERLFGAQNESR
jgi:hypothetical protein